MNILIWYLKQYLSFIKHLIGKSSELKTVSDAANAIPDVFIDHAVASSRTPSLSLLGK